MAQWYVSYAHAPEKIRMEIAKDRDEAITLACWMLKQGFDIHEVGPMLDPLSGNVISASEIREVYTRKSEEDMRVDDRLPTQASPA